MVRIPSLIRRSDSTAARDENADGRVNELDERAAVQDRDNTHGELADRTGARRGAAKRGTAVLDRDSKHDDDRVDRPRGRARVVGRDPATTDRSSATPDAVAAPAIRPRASGLATFGLMLGVLAAAAVATGVLAAAGVAVGVLGALVAIGAVATTSHTHVTGRLDAVLGLLLSLAAVVVGVLAVRNAIEWPDTDTNQVSRLVDWLNARLPWLDRF